MPDSALTSVNVPSPLLWNSWTEPVGSPRGPQFTGTPFQRQSAILAGLRQLLERRIQIGRDEQIQVAVAVVVDPRAAGAVADGGLPQAPPAR